MTRTFIILANITTVSHCQNLGDRLPAFSGWNDTFLPSAEILAVSPSWASRSHTSLSSSIAPSWGPWHGPAGPFCECVTCLTQLHCSGWRSERPLPSSIPTDPRTFPSRSIHVWICSLLVGTTCFSEAISNLFQMIKRDNRVAKFHSNCQVGKPKKTPRASEETCKAGRLQRRRGDGQDGDLPQGHPHVPADEHPPQLLRLETPAANSGTCDSLEPEGGPRGRDVLHAQRADRPDDLRKLPACALDHRDHGRRGSHQGVCLLWGHAGGEWVFFVGPRSSGSIKRWGSGRKSSQSLDLLSSAFMMDSQRRQRSVTSIVCSLLVATVVWVTGDPLRSTLLLTASAKSPTFFP